MNPPGPAQLVLTASVARRYYLDGKSKVEIAEELNLSRFKVARLLENARATSMVRIEIGHPGEIDVGLSADLRDVYGLQHAIVVDAVDEHPAELRRHVGRAGAELLSEIVTSDDVLGLGWARSLLAMRTELRSLAPCPVVQLTGALSRPDVDDSSVDLVRDVARIGGGPAYFFYAPMLVSDATTAAVFRQQSEVARAFGRFADVTKAMVGVGAWKPTYSTVYDATSAGERRDLARRGVHAEVSGVLLDDSGRPVAAPFSQRVLGIPAAQLQAIPEVIALAYGPEKASAARAAILGGFVSGLVTHTSFAEALLAAAG